MAKTLYLMRHGQTLFNLRHKVQGWCDVSLTDFGIYQAKVAGKPRPVSGRSTRPLSGR